MKQKYFDHYIFSGTHREVGRQHGEALRGQIQEHLQITYANAKRVSGIDPERALQVASLYAPYIAQHAPGFLEEIEGLGEGANITSQEALLLQVRQEATYLSLYGQGGFESECSSYAVGPGYTADGKMYAGQNADLAGNFEDVSNVITFAVEDKPQVMMVVPAGQISYLGMNSEGMGVNCNFLACDGWRKGYPRYLISRLLMEQRTFEEACQVMDRLTERSSSRNVLLTDYKGNIADFETTSIDIGRIDAEGMFVHTNHFLDIRMQQYEKATGNSWVDTHWRYYRIRQLMENNKGKITPEVIKEILRDHAMDPIYNKISICTHECDESNYYHTFTAMIENLTDLTMEITCGNPCENEFKTYRFA